MYGHDDWALLAATILAIGQYISVLAALSKGLGKSQKLLSIPNLLELKRVSIHVILLIKNEKLTVPTSMPQDMHTSTSWRTAHRSSQPLCSLNGSSTMAQGEIFTPVGS